MKLKFTYLLIFIKGMAMGIADLVPGISGGTIALITGIYQELLSSINQLNIENIKSIRSHGFVIEYF